MASILFLVFLAFYLSVFVYTLYGITFKSQHYLLIVFLIFYLPGYTTFQSIILSFTGSGAYLIIWQVLKEFMVFITALAFLFTLKNPFDYRFKLRTVDFLYFSFVFLALAYTILPIGSVGFVSKLVYFKSILLPAVMYFFGRNMRLSRKQELVIARSILFVLVATFCVNYTEYITGIHYQKLIGWVKYNIEILEVEPHGYYGLGWNFENGPTSPRFAAFYSNSLEAGNSAILTFATAFFLLWHTKYRKNIVIYCIAALMAYFSNYLAFSRSALVALLMSMLLIALLLRYYAFLGSLFVLFVLGVISFILFAEDEMKYFVIDTLTFQQASSLGHLLEWLQGIESMMSSPQGIGLGTSGSLNLVEEEQRIGGENQYIIYGVQLGVLGLFLFVSLMLSAIITSFKAFNIAGDANGKMFPFIATVTKFGLLLPLFTAGVDGFLFVTFISWWMVGYSVATYNRYKLEEGQNNSIKGVLS